MSFTKASCLFSLFNYMQLAGIIKACFHKAFIKDDYPLYFSQADTYEERTCKERGCSKAYNNKDNKKQGRDKG